MKGLIIIAIIVVVAMIASTQSVNVEGFKSKCFSCEAQDNAMGLSGDRGYGSKCFSCEAQDNAMGLGGDRGYGSKCFSCEAQDYYGDVRPYDIPAYGPGQYPQKTCLSCDKYTGVMSNRCVNGCTFTPPYKW